MKKYLVLYQSSVKAADQMASANPEQAQAGMDLWTSWMGKAGHAIVEIGQPSNPLTTIRPDGSSTAPTAPYVGGYGILQAESLADLEKVLVDHPHFHAADASIAVLELIDLPGM
ncbi:MAG: hypothetical protein OEY70_19510 [Acidimicrobiia bacterium]|nr:hypothetical protein [Acidimicrobiia bacterium]